MDASGRDPATLDVVTPEHCEALALVRVTVALTGCPPSECEATTFRGPSGLGTGRSDQEHVVRRQSKRATNPTG